MTTLNKEFIPYDLALKLKELGFDEECLGRYGMNSKKLFLDAKLTFKNSADLYSDIPNDWCNDFVAAPLWQQAFEWFREKYKLHSYIYSDYSWNISGGIWDLNEHKDSRYDWDSDTYTTYQEAQLDCLTKLIEIVQQNEAVKSR